MSADNYLLIKKVKSQYIVEDCMSENTNGSLVGSADTLETAIRIAEEYQQNNIVEYGIHFSL